MRPALRGMPVYLGRPADLAPGHHLYRGYHGSADPLPAALFHDGGLPGMFVSGMAKLPGRAFPAGGLVPAGHCCLGGGGRGGSGLCHFAGGQHRAPGQYRSLVGTGRVQFQCRLGQQPGHYLDGGADLLFRSGPGGEADGRGSGRHGPVYPQRC